jgi:hypothetical protein
MWVVDGMHFKGTEANMQILTLYNNITPRITGVSDFIHRPDFNN